MSAWDDPVAHIRALEAEVELLRGVVSRVEVLAGEWEVLSDYVNDHKSTADQRARSKAGVIAAEQLRSTIANPSAALDPR